MLQKIHTTLYFTTQNNSISGERAQPPRQTLSRVGNETPFLKCLP